MQTANTIVLRVLLAIAAVVVFSNSSAEEIVENLKLGGSFLTSRIDNNVDGEASSWCTLQIKGGIQGSSMQQCINEDVFIGPSEDCPAGVYVVDANNNIGGGRGVRTFANGVDQLFIALTERYLCADVGEQGLFFKESYDRGVITGGIGRFAGATGTYEYNYTGTVLTFDFGASPPQFFGSISGTGTYNIVIPD